MSSCYSICNKCNQQYAGRLFDECPVCKSRDIDKDTELDRERLAERPDDDEQLSFKDEE